MFFYNVKIRRVLKGTDSALGTCFFWKLTSLQYLATLSGFVATAGRKLPRTWIRQQWGNLDNVLSMIQPCCVNDEGDCCKVIIIKEDNDGI